MTCSSLFGTLTLKVRGTITDINGSHGNPPDEMEKPHRATSVNAARQRADPRLKMHVSETIS